MTDKEIDDLINEMKTKPFNIDRSTKLANELTHTVLIKHSNNKYTGVLYMTERMGNEFHKMINDWHNDKSRNYEISCSNQVLK